jgi:cytochrome c5
MQMARIERWLFIAALALAAQPGSAGEAAGSAGFESDVRAYNLAHGRVVFSEKCLTCHEGGRKGAPVLGETEDWRERLDQPLDTLIEHAIGGHGRMPPRGDQDLSDQDVAAAVAYVVNRARVIAALEGQQIEAPLAGPTAAQVDTADDAVLQMFLMLLGKERWK